MADRLTSLRRIERVQDKLVQLETSRVAMADRLCRDLEEDRHRLRAFMTGHDPLGASLAKAIARSADSIEKRHARAEHLRAGCVERLRAQRSRGEVVGSMVAKAAVEARRAEEDRDLAAAMEAWLSRGDVSLP